jgi:hypothetical protein
MHPVGDGLPDVPLQAPTAKNAVPAFRAVEDAGPYNLK